MRVPPPKDGPRALVVSLSGFPYQLKLESMLLKALELDGYRPVVLTDRTSVRRARRYFGAFGIEHLELVERYRPRDFDPASTAHIRKALATGPVDMHMLKSMTYHGTHIGRQALSTISRSRLQGSVALDDPGVISDLRDVLEAAAELCVTAERMLDEVDPDLVIFNEARYSAFGPIFETALRQGRNVIQFVHAFSDDAFVFKRYTEATGRFHPRSLGDAAWEEVKAGPWTLQMERELEQQFDVRYGAEDSLSRRLYRHVRQVAPTDLRNELGLNPGKKTAVLFSHLLWDANLFYGEDLFDDQEAWLVETVRAAAANENLNWVIKLHPANVWKLEYESHRGELNEVAAIRRKVGPLPAHITLLMPDTNVSTLSLFELADYAVTIRGTVGIEAPCFGIPVVTAGTSHYSGRGFTLDSGSANEYRELLAKLQDLPQLSEEQVLLAKKHAHALFCRRPIHFTSFRSKIASAARTGEALDHDLFLNIHSRSELVEARDLREFADWAVDREREDYLAPLSRDGVG
jgi:hypothetical protein